MRTPATAVIVGTHVHPASGDAARRQRRALDALRDASPITPVNLQFADRRGLQEVDGLETTPLLRQDSNGITGRAGTRKPIVSELFTRLAELAVARGLRCFVYTNSDIVFSRAAFDHMTGGGHNAYVLSRTDVAADTGRDIGPLVHGADVFAVDARWWLANRRRFRPYIVGESVWDNVYTAQLLCWAGGVLLNRDPLVRHESHPIVWGDSPFAEHNGILGALDRMYFSRWVMYVGRLERMRREAGGLADEEEEMAMQREVFSGWTPDLADRVLQALRVAKLRLRLLGRAASTRRAARS